MKQTVILKNKLFLYLTEFFSGMSVMAVELGASRLLAPYFSSSQIVWTIIIGTIMIAMALGNIYGGRSADKSPNPDRLYTRILIAAIWIALIPVAGKYIVLGISALLIFTVSNNFLIIAAFAACMVIFVFPLFLLGTVTPSLVKYAVDSLDDNGKTVGTLGAFNTIGSIIVRLCRPRDDSGGWNVYHVSDLLGNSTGSGNRVFCQCPRRQKESDRIGGNLCTVLRSWLLGFVCILGEESHL